jgi:hypothetical protein
VLREIYLKVHLREIADSELDHIKQALASDFSGTIIAMLRSSELLSNLLHSDPIPEVAPNALNYALRSRKTEDLPEMRFFLHIPKSGGTSVIHHLNQHSDLFWHQHDSKDKAPLHLWPLLTGHFHWTLFPSDSRGFTILRDPLERLISAWRFQTSYSQYLFRKSDQRSLLNLNLTDFLNDVLQDEKATDRTLLSWFFTDEPLQKQVFTETPHHMLEKNFNNFYANFEHIACIEDAHSVTQALTFATGNAAPLATTRNQTNRENSEIHSLSKAEYDRLFELTSFDYRFLNQLFEKGIISYDYSKNKEEKLIRYLTRQGLTIE